MLTNVANNALNYFKDSLFRNTNSNLVELKFEDFKNKQLDESGPFMGNLKSAATKYGGSLWTAYHPEESNPEKEVSDFIDEEDEGLTPLEMISMGACSVCRFNMSIMNSWAKYELV
jgi:hypothetical protein